jgi:hypothetical protein
VDAHAVVPIAYYRRPRGFLIVARRSLKLRLRGRDLAKNLLDVELRNEILHLTPPLKVFADLPALADYP